MIRGRVTDSDGVTGLTAFDGRVASRSRRRNAGIHLCGYGVFEREWRLLVRPTFARRLHRDRTVHQNPNGAGVRPGAEPTRWQVSRIETQAAFERLRSNIGGSVTVNPPAGSSPSPRAPTPSAGTTGHFVTVNAGDTLNRADISIKEDPRVPACPAPCVALTVRLATLSFAWSRPELDGVECRAWRLCRGGARGQRRGGTLCARGCSARPLHLELRAIPCGVTSHLLSRLRTAARANLSRSSDAHCRDDSGQPCEGFPMPRMRGVTPKTTSPTTVL